MEAWLLALGLLRLLSPSASETVCSRTESISGGTVQFPKHLGVGSVLRYHCPEGKRAFPVSWRVCLRNGHWSPLRNAFQESSRTARCLGFRCVGPTYIENGFFHPRKVSYAVGDTIEFECDEGFNLIGSQRRTCLKNGRWSGETVVCDGGETFCLDPGIPLGGSRRGDSFEEGDTVSYTCFSNLVLTGSASRTCNSAGQWEGTEANCEFPFSYDDPSEVAETLTLSEKITDRDKQGTHLYFVVDASGSVGEENFNISLRFIEEFIIMTTEISPNIYYFVKVFASEILSELNLGKRPIDWHKFQQINYMNFENKLGTNIGGVLMNVLESINETMKRPHKTGVPIQIILLLTDGRHNIGPNPPDVVKKIKEIIPDPDLNLDIYAIGIGDANRHELAKITTNREEPHSFYFQNYDQLQELTDMLNSNEGPVSGCGVRGLTRSPRSVARVYGGQEVSEKQWPWQVRLNLKGARGGGTIVSPSWILTAAHNVFDSGKLLNSSDIQAFAGSLKRTSGLKYKVRDILVHDLYNESAENFAFDIALLRLQNVINYRKNIRPICLPCTKEVSKFLRIPAGDWTEQCTFQDRILTGFGGTEPRNVSGYVSGWGGTQDRHISYRLNYGLISVKPRDECMKDNLDPSLFCAKGRGVDACQGDSGGPFATKFNQRWIQIGITSSGHSGQCSADNMGYYTNVVRMMEWLREKVTDIQYE